MSHHSHIEELNVGSTDIIRSCLEDFAADILGQGLKGVRLDDEALIAVKSVTIRNAERLARARFPLKEQADTREQILQLLEHKLNHIILRAKVKSKTDLGS